MYDPVNLVGFHIFDLQTNEIIHDFFHSTCCLEIINADAHSYNLPLFQSWIVSINGLDLSPFIYSNESVIFRFLVL